MPHRARDVAGRRPDSRHRRARARVHARVASARAWLRRLARSMGARAAGGSGGDGASCSSPLGSATTSGARPSSRRRGARARGRRPGRHVRRGHRRAAVPARAVRGPRRGRPHAAGRRDDRQPRGRAGRTRPRQDEEVAARRRARGRAADRADDPAGGGDDLRLAAAAGNASERHALSGGHRGRRLPRHPRVAVHPHPGPHLDRGHRADRRSRSQTTRSRASARRAGTPADLRELDRTLRRQARARNPAIADPRVLGDRARGARAPRPIAGRRAGRRPRIAALPSRRRSLSPEAG